MDLSQEEDGEASEGGEEEVRGREGDSIGGEGRGEVEQEAEREVA